MPTIYLLFLIFVPLFPFCFCFFCLSSLSCIRHFTFFSSLTFIFVSYSFFFSLFLFFFLFLCSVFVLFLGLFRIYFLLSFFTLFPSFAIRVSNSYPLVSSQYFLFILFTSCMAYVNSLAVWRKEVCRTLVLVTV